jgi:hypothetical protein
MKHKIEFLVDGQLVLKGSASDDEIEAGIGRLREIIRPAPSNYPGGGLGGMEYPHGFGNDDDDV